MALFRVVGAACAALASWATASASEAMATASVENNLRTRLIAHKGECGDAGQHALHLLQRRHLPRPQARTARIQGALDHVCWAPGAENYLRDCIGIFRDYGWDWTYHAFREWAGWSVEHEGEDDATLRPSADNPRKRALLEGMRDR